MNLITYFRLTAVELKQVSWPSRDKTVKLTAIVLGISLLVAAYVGGLDFLFTNTLTLLLNQ